MGHLATDNFFFPPTVTSTERSTNTLRFGEVVLDTTLMELYVGDGTTVGGLKLADFPDLAVLQQQMILALGAGTPFRVPVTLTAAAAATPVHVVPAASVPAGKAVFVTDVYGVVNGATAWTDVTATKVQLQDTAGSPVVGMSWLKALLTGNAVFSNGVPSSMGSAMALGFTQAKGLDFVGDANFAAGSTITLLVCGYIA